MADRRAGAPRSRTTIRGDRWPGVGGARGCPVHERPRDPSRDRADPPTDGSVFTAILALLICPVSAALLSDAFFSRTFVGALSRRLMIVAVSTGLPLTHFVRQACHHLAGTLLSAVSCFPLLITFLLLARASIAYSVACCYAGKKILVSEFLALLRGKWRRLVSTYLWAFYPALLAVLAFSIVYAHTIIVCNLASVISVLEDKSGLEALLRSICLVRGQTQAGLMIFLGRRLEWLLSKDCLNTDAVFYFTCRSSSIEELSWNSDTPVEDSRSHLNRQIFFFYLRFRDE
ncbi:unnamed protein product [Spirodela intermedia]|uniref:Uncharacterized protein n=1 Tax=Spirodela intermedia TaxID=51605 RepID=A0A7I8IIX5_SPIIN|nr:unnamed protein product [Spirodela intermedia]CAA6657440.1 unnamed protein product [Spirodela intermedia]